MPYAIAVSMVLDQIDDRRLLLLEAFRSNRLHDLMASVKTALDSELRAVPADDPHLKHVFESVKPHPGYSWMDSLSEIVRKGRDELTGNRLASRHPSWSLAGSD